MTPLMDRAKPQGKPEAPPEKPPAAQGGFQKPNIDAFIPPETKDAVDRVVAAGMRMMYAPAMREDLQAEIARDAPVPQKLAESTAGLVLTLDQQAKGGIPVQAIFPAAVGLLGEASEVLAAAGQPVTQEDYNAAALQVFAILGRKMGASDDEIMQTASQMVPQEAA